MGDRTGYKEITPLRHKVDSILKRVYRICSTNNEEVFGRKRQENIVAARHSMFYVMHKEAGLSGAEIARLGGWKPSAVYYGLKRYERIKQEIEVNKRPEDPISGCVSLIKAIEDLGL